MNTRTIIATIYLIKIVLFALVWAFSLSQNTALSYESGKNGHFDTSL